MKSKIVEILQNIKLNKLNIILIFLVILVGLLSFVYFRDSSRYISEYEYSELLKSGAISSAHIDGDKAYLRYNSREYVVLKEAIDLKELFEKTKISPKK